MCTNTPNFRRFVIHRLTLSSEAARSASGRSHDELSGKAMAPPSIEMPSAYSDEPYRQHSPSRCKVTATEESSYSKLILHTIFAGQDYRNEIAVDPDFGLITTHGRLIGKYMTPMA